MASLTLAEFTYQIKVNLGNRDDLSDPTLTTFVNNAINKIARQYPFREYEHYLTNNVTSGDRFLVLPSDYRDCYSVSLINGAQSRMLKRLTIREWEYYIPYPERYATGLTTYYTIWRNNLEFWRIPDSAYVVNVRMTYWPTSLLNVGDTCEFTHKDDIILHYAVSEAFMALRMPDDAQIHTAIAERAFMETKKRDVLQSDNVIRDARNDPGFYNGSDYWNNPFVR